MLGVGKYPQGYVDSTRAHVESAIAAYTGLVSAAEGSTLRLDDAIEAFDSVFYNNMVVVLDHYFCHRLRTVEGKDGNPLNETRVLCDSIMDNNGLMASDSTIRLNPEASLLGYGAGDRIALGEEDFRRLHQGFFAEIESKFV